VTQRRCAPPWQAMSRSDPDHDAIRTLSLHLRLGAHAGHKRTSFPFIEGFLRKLAKSMRTQAPAWAAHGIGPIPSSSCASGFDLDQGTGECVALYGNCWPPSFTRFASAAVSGLPQKACASGAFFCTDPGLSVVTLPTGAGSQALISSACSARPLVKEGARSPDFRAWRGRGYSLSPARAQVTLSEAQRHAGPW